MLNPLWGINLRGSKIDGIILYESDKPLIIKRLSTSIEIGFEYENILFQIEKLINTLSAETGLRPNKIGLSHPGTFDPKTNRIKNAHALSLNGRPIKDDLQRLLRIPVKLANDAICFTVAETLMGAAYDVLPNAEVILGLIIGNSVGGGLVVHGKPINGRQGNVGQWGHNLLVENGHTCWCGKKGCVETVISGRALESYYKGLTGNSLKLKEIVNLSKSNDLAAVETIDRLVHHYGKAVASVINIVDPDVIVIGGGVGNIDRLYTDGVEEARKWVFNSERLDTIFVKPKLGDSAGVFGAALL